MVLSDDQPLQILNFRRRDRSRDAERTATDWIFKDDGDWEEAGTLSHVDLINHFQDLKFVVGGRERDTYEPPEPLEGDLLKRREVIERLKILATVEHALCVGISTPTIRSSFPPGSGPQREPWQAGVRPSDQTPEDARIFTAASEVLTVAIDGNAPLSSRQRDVDRARRAACARRARRSSASIFPSVRVSSDRSSSLRSRRRNSIGSSTSKG
jgi:hypothetical protein